MNYCCTIRSAKYGQCFNHQELLLQEAPTKLWYLLRSFNTIGSAPKHLALFSTCLIFQRVADSCGFLVENLRVRASPSFTTTVTCGSTILLRKNGRKLWLKNEMDPHLGAVTEWFFTKRFSSLFFFVGFVENCWNVLMFYQSICSCLGGFMMFLLEKRNTTMMFTFLIPLNEYGKRLKSLEHLRAPGIKTIL